MLRFFENIGSFVISLLREFVIFYKFSIVCILNLFHPKSYNSASRKILVEQIYFTAIEILPIFLLFAVIFGALFMGFIINLSIQYSLQKQLSNIIVQFVIVEFVPFFMALLISLKTGLRVGIKTAIMKVNNELNMLEVYKIDIMKYQFAPRAMAGILSFLSLAVLFSVIMIFSGYLFMFFSINMDFARFISSLTNAVTIKYILIFIFKSIIYGFLIIVIPSYFGETVEKRYINIPLRVSRSMIVLFATIFVLEAISLVIQFL